MRAVMPAYAVREMLTDELHTHALWPRAKVGLMLCAGADLHRSEIEKTVEEDGPDRESEGALPASSSTAP